jgi:tetratricopeptide (TPR) repeat protein
VSTPNGRRAAAILTLFVGLLAVPHPAGTQSGPRRLPGFETTQEWIQIARSHRAGETDAAVTMAMAKGVTDADGRRLSDDLAQVIQDLNEVQALTRAITQGQSEVVLSHHIMKMGDLVPLLGLSDKNDGFPDRKSLKDPDSPQWRGIAEAMIAVALLHTEVAMTPPELWGKNRPGAAVEIRDGRIAAGLDLRLQYEVARAAVDVALPSTKGGAFGRLWYHATAAVLQQNRNYLALLPHLEHARLALPDEARMFLFGGVAFENLAAPSAQVTFQQEGNWVNLAQPPELLFKAEALFRRALELDPASAETRVRLGRVQYLKGRHADALAVLTKAETDANPSLTKYYAALFRGRAAERMGDDEQARLAYERARTLFPDVQSPRMALAAMDLRLADQATALANLRALFLMPDAQPAADPWWTYDVWLVQDAADLMAQVRAARAAASRW